MREAGAWRRGAARFGAEIAPLLLAWAATRGSLLLVGWLSLQLLPSGAPLMSRNLRFHETRPASLEMWARWDSEWYLLIAERGYEGSREVLRDWPNYREEDASGFFPLYPALVRIAGGALGDSVLGGVVVSNLALLVAAWFLTRLVRLDHGEAAAWFVPWVLFAYPTSLFLSAVYAEALFLALGVGSVYAARRKRWWWAGGLGFGAALARPLGFLLILPLAWELFRDRGRPARSWLAVGMIPLGTAGFLAFCQATYGDFLAPLARQVRWRGAGSGPWRAFERFFENPEVHGAHNSSLDLIVAVAVLASLPLLFRFLRPGYALYATAAALLPLCTSLWSYSRLSLAVFPLFHLLAIGCARWRWFAPAYLCLCLPAAALFMSMFASGWWVG